jgi:hypothetical protein
MFSLMSDCEGTKEAANIGTAVKNGPGPEMNKCQTPAWNDVVADIDQVEPSLRLSISGLFSKIKCFHSFKKIELNNFEIQNLFLEKCEEFLLEIIHLIRTKISVGGWSKSDIVFFESGIKLISVLSPISAPVEAREN